MDILQTWLRKQRVIQTVPVFGDEHYIERPVRVTNLAAQMLPTVGRTPSIAVVARAPTGAQVNAATAAAVQSIAASRYPVPAQPGPARAPQKNEQWKTC